VCAVRTHHDRLATLSISVSQVDLVADFGGVGLVVIVVIDALAAVAGDWSVM
jgi:hypothetical protein